MSNLKFKLYPVLILLLVVLISLFLGYKLFFKPKFKTIKIGQAKISVEIADTPEKKAKGLSGRTSLPENQGMLFVFEKPDYYSFWMKDMFIPLDFVWISNSQVVEITQNVKPEDYQPPKALTPQNEVNQVLEIKAGLAQKLNLKLGDKVTFD